MLGFVKSQKNVMLLYHTIAVVLWQKKKDNVTLWYNKFGFDNTHTHTPTHTNKKNKKQQQQQNNTNRKVRE